MHAIEELLPILPYEILKKSAELPLKPAPVTLQGQYVKLVPLIPARDAAALFAVSNGQPARLGERTVEAYDADALIWRFMWEGPFATVEDFNTRLEQQCAGANTLPLCVLNVATEQPVGMTTFMSNSPENLKIELGGIWYSPLVQGTHVNTEATYLMLGHAFELGYRRVEWKCNDRNYRSRRAALRMGFQFEGIQESHMIVKGRSRDTAWFRMLAHEWPSAKAQLETLLYG